MKKKVVPKLRQEVKVKIDIVTSDDIKIYYTEKFQDFTAKYIIKIHKKWCALFQTGSCGRMVLRHAPSQGGSVMNVSDS